MDSVFHIGASKEAAATAKEIAQAVNSIMEAGREFGMDQKTIRLALEAYQRQTEISHVTISGSNFTGTEKK